MRQAWINLKEAWSIDVDRWRRAAAAVGSAATFTAVFHTGLAHAQTPPGLELEYAAPADCGSKQVVLSKLEQALGQAADDRPDASRVSAEVHITTRDQEYRLEYRADRDGIRSRRVLTLDSCEAVTEASALLLLLTIDPILADTMGATQLVESADADDEPAPSEPIAEAPPEELPDPIAVPTPSPAPRRETPRDTKAPETSSEPTKLSAAWLGLGPTLSSGVAANTALGVGAEGGLCTRWWALSAGVSWLPALDTEISGISGSRVESAQLRLLSRAALRLGSGRFRYGPYVGASFDRVSVDVTGISEPGGGATQWLSVLGGVSLDARLWGSWALGLRGGVSVATERPRFTLRQVEQVAHQPSAVGAEAFLGVLWVWDSQSP